MKRWHGSWGLGGNRTDPCGGGTGRRRKGQPSGRDLRGQACLRAVRGDVNCWCHGLSSPGNDEDREGTFSVLQLPVFSFFSPAPHVLLLLSDSSGADVAYFSPIFMKVSMM